MKIFISHSGRDKWVARKISEDLNRLGATTFLDEKDIETGASIDDSISEHLKSCDEILILLSPSSLSSHWVLIEVGGAKALGKRLIPILFHVGTNEIPAPISKHLAREINDIERYYSEVTTRLVTKIIPEPAVHTVKKVTRKPKKKRQINVGDKVKIIGPSTPNERDDVGWVVQMNEYRGKTATVTLVEDKDRIAYLEIDDMGLVAWQWAFEWLSKI